MFNRFIFSFFRFPIIKNIVRIHEPCRLIACVRARARVCVQCGTPCVLYIRLSSSETVLIEMCLSLSASEKRKINGKKKKCKQSRWNRYTRGSVSTSTRVLSAIIIIGDIVDVAWLRGNFWKSLIWEAALRYAKVFGKATCKGRRTIFGKCQEKISTRVSSPSHARTNFVSLDINWFGFREMQEMIFLGNVDSMQHIYE